MAHLSSILRPHTAVGNLKIPRLNFATCGTHTCAPRCGKQFVRAARRASTRRRHAALRTRTVIVRLGDAFGTPGVGRMFIGPLFASELAARAIRHSRAPLARRYRLSCKSGADPPRRITSPTGKPAITTGESSPVFGRRPLGRRSGQYLGEHPSDLLAKAGQCRVGVLRLSGIRDHIIG